MDRVSDVLCRDASVANLPLAGTSVFTPPYAVTGQCGAATPTCTLAGATVKCT